MCVVRGEEQKRFLEGLLRSEYPSGEFAVVDSVSTPTFKEEIKSRYVWAVSYTHLTLPTKRIV